MQEWGKMIVIIIGLVLLAADFVVYARRRLSEGIGMGWGLVAVVLILFGAVPGLSEWAKVLPKEAYPAVFGLGGFALFSLFHLSTRMSNLIQKNQELAMQVSLLNQENEQILAALEQRED